MHTECLTEMASKRLLVIYHLELVDQRQNLKPAIKKFSALMVRIVAQSYR